MEDYNTITCQNQHHNTYDVKQHLWCHNMMSSKDIRWTLQQTDMTLYCKTLYFHVFFISRFCDIKLIRGNLNLQCLMLSYVNTIHSNILQECWIRETSNSRILAKIKVLANKSLSTVYSHQYLLDSADWVTSLPLYMWLWLVLTPLVWYWGTVLLSHTFDLPEPLSCKQMVRVVLLAH